MSETQPTGTCQLCRQTRPLFEWTDIPEPWADAVDYQLCVRCWGRADSADANGNPLDMAYLCREAKRQMDALNAMSKTAQRA